MNTPSAAQLPVPPLNLSGNFAALEAELLAEVSAICRSGYYILGPKVVAFEAALAQYCGAAHALGVSSGTDGLLLAMMALEIGPGHEVIVPTFTFFATAGCVARLGATPVFCDVQLDTFNLDVTQVERLITPRTRAIIPVHLYGQMADLPALQEIARRRGVAIIEDAAQAIGARLPAQPQRAAGAWGEFGVLSFYPTKNLGALGDAGALLTNDPKLFEAARLLRTHGENPRYYHRRIGGNFRIDALQAAILAIKLRHLEEWTRQRRARAARYTALVEESGLVPEFVRPPREVLGTHVFHQYVIRVPRRDELMAHLTARQIGSGIYYPVPLHLQDCFAYLGGKPGQFPRAEQIVREVLALPIYPELSEAQQQTVVGAIREFYER